MKYNCPSSFGRFDKEISITEFNKEELLEILIDSARNDDYNNIDDFVKDYDDLFTCV